MPSTVCDGMPKACPRASGSAPAVTSSMAVNSPKPLFSQTNSDRQPPDRRHVHDLEQQALIERAVAEEGGGDLALAVPLGAQRRAGGERNAAADNAGGAEIAVGRIEDVQ